MNERPYTDTVRQDCIDRLADLKAGNPQKYQMVVDEIVDLIRGAKLYEPAGPDK